MHEHVCLANKVSEDEAILMFNIAAWNVVKDAIKHARCIFVATYFSQVNLLLFCTHVLK
jgi:hypothetical protein